MSDFDGYEVDDVLSNDGRRKRKKSKSKGKRGELALVKLLNERFDTQAFSRVVGSGNRWSQVECVSKDYIGDIICPANFRFAIECKCGYQEVDTYAAIQGPVAALDSFLTQAEEDAKRSNRQPLLCWKKDRQSWLGFTKSNLLEENIEYQIKYRDWTGTGLSRLFLLPNDFFFVGN